MSGSETKKRKRSPSSPPSAGGSTGAQTWSERFSELHPRRFFLETWATLDQEAQDARDERHAQAPGTRDWMPILALVLGAVFLTVMDNEYFGGAGKYELFMRWLSRASWFREWAAPTFFGPDVHPLSVDAGAMFDALRDARFYRLGSHAWWAIWRVIGYFILPVLTIKLVLKKRVRDFGLETRGMSQHVWIYGLMYGIVLIGVIAVSFTESFSSYYPFYKLAQRSWFDFFAWELLYAAQFFSLEFFFRGFWLQACRRSLGSYAIFAMVVPYCMIHFGKPMAETFGAIIAGVALGTLAMKTRSIWSGFLIHVSVALSMDIAALLQTAVLPDRWWP